ncbi:hypothetical protein Tco_0449945 [Tanacetum coccineum]
MLPLIFEHLIFEPLIFELCYDPLVIALLRNKVSKLGAGVGFRDMSVRSGRYKNSALTWWNSHKRTIGVEAAYLMNWVELMKLMTEVYCPRNEIQKIETEL